MADDENESEETAAYDIQSATGLWHESTDTIADIIYQIHELVHGPKRDLKMLRDLTEDLWSIAAINDENSIMLEDTLGELDSLDELPAGWTSEADDDEAE